jgi:hypothetical protein
MKHNKDKYTVTIEMVAAFSPEESKRVLKDEFAVFTDISHMSHCAEKAGVVIIDYFEYFGTDPHHRYALADFEGMLLDGDIPRVSGVYTPSSNPNPALQVTSMTAEDSHNHYYAETAVDVSKGKISKAAEPLRVVPKNEIEQELERKARSIKMPETFATPYGEDNDAISKAVSGSHYNEVVPGYQYMEMMQHMLGGKEGVEAHLLGQVYKYLMRAGKKDDVEQEYRKARWYLNCLVKFEQTGEVDPNNND